MVRRSTASRRWSGLVAGVFLALGACTATAPSADTTMLSPELVTAAESSDYRATMPHADVVAFLDALAERSERVRRFSFGTSHEGRDLAAIWITEEPLDPNPESAERAILASEKPLVLLVGNIHAGEVCGKEALCMLARELSGGDPVLERLDLAVLPNYNPDGNERFAPDNRPGQHGPDEMGTRANAQELDLNRDWTKAEAPETRAFLAFLARFDPEVIVDTHTTNGSLHRYTLTYQGPKHPAGDAELIAFGRDVFLPAVGERMRARAGYDSFFYGNFDREHRRWEGYPAQPRYGAVYRGLRNRLTVLTEAYSYAPFRDRVLATLDFCRGVLEEAADRSTEIRALLDAADARTVAAGRAGADEVPVEVELAQLAPRIVVPGYAEHPDEQAPPDVGARPGAPVDYPVEHWNAFAPTVTVRRPAAYLVAPEASGLAERLALHGLRLEEPVEPVRLTATALRLAGFVTAERTFQGHLRREDAQLVELPVELEVGPGWCLVPTDQPLGTLAVILLEPRSEDGLFAWNALDPWCKEGETLPVHRLAGPLPDLATRPFTTP